MDMTKLIKTIAALIVGALAGIIFMYAAAERVHLEEQCPECTQEPCHEEPCENCVEDK